MIPSETIACHCSNGLSGAAGWRCSRTCSASCGHLLHQRIALGEDLERQLGLVELLQPLGALVVDRRADEGLDQGAVQAEVDLRDPPHGGEAALVLGARAGRWPGCRPGCAARSARSSRRRSLPGWRRRPTWGVMTASYSPGGSTSIRSMLEANSWCSFLATPPETKMPRWPTLSCTA